MADKPSKEEKIEETFVQRLMREGWPAGTPTYLAAKLEDLGNPDPRQKTYGCSDAMGKKIAIINMPVEAADDLIRQRAAKKVDGK
jgi:hypothetical protein